MNLIKWNPVLSPSAKGFDKVVDELFNTSLSDLFQADFTTQKPSVNITESDESYTIEVAAPGMKKEDFELKLENAQLTISVTKEEKTEEEADKNFSRREFNYQSFKRMFHISDEINAESIEATYKDGILRIQLAKKEEAIEKSQVIEIK